MRRYWLSLIAIAASLVLVGLAMIESTPWVVGPTLILVALNAFFLGRLVEQIHWERMMRQAIKLAKREQDIKRLHESLRVLTTPGKRTRRAIEISLN